MSDTTVEFVRDRKNGRFVAGTGGHGRKLGSRNKLGEQFVSDLASVWQERGIEALRKCAEEDAPAFCRIIASLLPRQVDLSAEVSVEVTDFALRFRQAVQMLGNEPPRKLPRVINGG